MRNLNVPILPGCTPSRESGVDQKEFRRFLRTRVKKVFSLNREQFEILFRIVFPYWENYLKSVSAAHPVTDAYIVSLRFGWAKEKPAEYPELTRIAQVVLETHISIDMLPEKIIFRVELCKDNVPHQCLIIHESRGRFEIAFRNQECDGIPH